MTLDIAIHHSLACLLYDHLNPFTSNAIIAISISVFSFSSDSCINKMSSANKIAFDELEEGECRSLTKFHHKALRYFHVTFYLALRFYLSH